MHARQMRRLGLIVGGLILAGVGVWAATAMWLAQATAALTAQEQGADRRVPGGSLVIVGGGVVPRSIREQFVQAAGGRKARIVIIPASQPSERDIERWLARWQECRALSVEICHAEQREDVNSPDFIEKLQQATGVWFGGGNQNFLAERYVDGPLEGMLANVLARQGVVGGSSAGAAILSRVMISAGDQEPVEGRGLGLLSDAIVDQHFLRRNRCWRLQQMLRKHEELIGLGIDERTALIVHPRSGRMSVVGESYVVACVPTSDSLPRLEILKPGDTVFLDQLRAEHITPHEEVDWDNLGMAIDE